MKAKRFAALLMAVMLIVGVFAIPAAAAIQCSVCQKTANYYRETYSVDGRYTGTCSNCGSTTRSALVYDEYKCSSSHLTGISTGKQCMFCPNHGAVSYF